MFAVFVASIASDVSAVSAVFAAVAVSIELAVSTVFEGFSGNALDVNRKLENLLVVSLGNFGSTPPTLYSVSNCNPDRLDKESFD